MPRPQPSRARSPSFEVKGNEAARRQGLTMATSQSSQTDYSAWPTKQQAADAIGVSTKLVEQLATEGKLQTAKYRRPEGGPRLSVYHPADVERLRLERNPDAPPFVLPPEPDAPQAIARAQPQDLLQMLAAAITSQKSEKPPAVRIAERLFLSIQEASDYSGLPQSHIRRLMKAGTLPALRTGGGWRIKRADLEKL